MRLLSDIKNKIDFYLINYKLILDVKSGCEIKLRTPFKARKFYKQKFVRLKITEEDLKWSKCVNETLEMIEYNKVSELIELSYLRGKEICVACDKVGIVDSTYFSWMSKIRFYVMIHAVSDGLISRLEIKDSIKF